MSQSQVIRKTSPVMSDVHVNTPLTNLSVAMIQDQTGFVAGKVFPTLPVMKQTDVYFVYDRSYWNRAEAQKRAPLAPSAGGDIGITTDSYFADVWAVHKDIPDQLRANADGPIRLDSDATEWVTLQLMLRRELEWVSNYFATSKWGKDVTGVNSGANGSTTFLRWNDANSTPIEDVRTGCTYVQQLTGFRPNTLTLGRQVYDKLLDHPDVIDRIKYGQSSGNVAQANLEILAQLFELDNVFVASAIQNTAKQGQTAVHSFVAGKNALLTYSPASPSLMMPAAGITMAWNGYTGGNAEGIAVSKFRRQLEVKADRVEGEMAWAQKLVSTDLGYFFSTAVA